MTALLSTIANCSDAMNNSSNVTNGNVTVTIELTGINNTDTEDILEQINGVAPPPLMPPSLPPSLPPGGRRRALAAAFGQRRLSETETEGKCVSTCGVTSSSVWPAMDGSMCENIVVTTVYSHEETITEQFQAQFERGLSAIQDALDVITVNTTSVVLSNSTVSTAVCTPQLSAAISTVFYVSTTPGNVTGGCPVDVVASLSKLGLAVACEQVAAGVTPLPPTPNEYVDPVVVIAVTTTTTTASTMACCSCCFWFCCICLCQRRHGKQKPAFLRDDVDKGRRVKISCMKAVCLHSTTNAHTWRMLPALLRPPSFFLRKTSPRSCATLLRKWSRAARSV